ISLLPPGSESAPRLHLSRLGDIQIDRADAISRSLGASGGRPPSADRAWCAARDGSLPQGIRLTIDSHQHAASIRRHDAPRRGSVGAPGDARMTVERLIRLAAFFAAPMVSLERFRIAVTLSRRR